MSKRTKASSFPSSYWVQQILFITSLGTLFSVSISGSSSVDVCSKPCNPSKSPVSSPCPTALAGNCCFQNGTVIGLDLSRCDNLTGIPTNFFTANANHSLLKIEWMFLNISGLEESKVSKESLRGLAKLNYLALPSDFSSCLPTDDSWVKRQKVGKVALECSQPSNYCRILDEAAQAAASKVNETNVQYCPPNSTCVRVGPGLIDCDCEQGFYGYKCLRSGTFPFGLFFGVLSGSTVFLSALLWFTQRRHIKTQ